MPDLTAIALEYKSLGLSVVPVLKTKRPLGSWQKYQAVFMPDHKIAYAFSRPEVDGIAVVCGRVSGNFEGLDADCKYDLTGRMMERFLATARMARPDLVSRLVIAATRNAGYHFYYRCANVKCNLLLARRETTPEERLADPKRPYKTLLETRSNSSIIIVPPTRGYDFLQRNLHETPLIDAPEREFLLQLARSFNSYREDLPDFAGTISRRNETPDESPLLAYDQTDDVIPCLQRNGWVLVRRIGPRTYFRRPGDTDKETSGDFHHTLRLFKVFTSNSNFEPGKGYRPSAVFAFLECHGDFKVAAKMLLVAGYGVPYKDRR